MIRFSHDYAVKLAEKYGKFLRAKGVCDEVVVSELMFLKFSYVHHKGVDLTNDSEGWSDYVRSNGSSRCVDIFSNHVE